MGLVSTFSFIRCTNIHVFLVFFQVKTPIVNEKKSKVLIPGLPGHQAPVKAPNQSSQPEKRKKGARTEVRHRLNFIFIKGAISD